MRSLLDFEGKFNSYRKCSYFLIFSATLVSLLLSKLRIKQNLFFGVECIVHISFIRCQEYFLSDRFSWI